MSAAFDRSDEVPVCRNCGRELTVGEQCAETAMCEGCSDQQDGRNVEPKNSSAWEK